MLQSVIRLIFPSLFYSMGDDLLDFGLSDEPGPFADPLNAVPFDIGLDLGLEYSTDPATTESAPVLGAAGDLLSLDSVAEPASAHTALEDTQPTSEASQPADVVEALVLRNPDVSNVLCTCHLGMHVDTRQIARRLWNAEYNKKQGSLTLKSAKKRLSVAIYPSGKMTCMGARSEATARMELRRHARLVQRSIRYSEISHSARAGVEPQHVYVYHKARFLGFRVANIKAEWELGFPVDLHTFCELYGSHFSVYYEPDIFPALKLTLTDPKLTIQLFTTGTVGVTGATSVSDINFACKEVLYSLAKPCELHPIQRQAK